ncbi:WD40-repeat-containing domain protein [Trichoderma afarasin]
METTKPRSDDEYTIGWICSLPKEQLAATAMLDDIHLVEETRNGSFGLNYTLGSIGEYNVVIACLPGGREDASFAAIAILWMTGKFRNIKLGLLVGIGSGVSPKVRLGDVVVSTPAGQSAGVVQWDMKNVKGSRGFEPIGSLKHPSASLLTALTKLQIGHVLSGSKMPEYLNALQYKWPWLVSKYLQRNSLKKKFPKVDYDLINENITDDEDESEEEENPVFCDTSMVMKMEPKEALVHYGVIASGNQAVEDAELRDRLNKDLGGHVLCAEMGAAAPAQCFPCLVIRGISDHADSQKDDEWQGHAAAMAAAFAKELLQYVEPEYADQEPLAKVIVDKFYNERRPSLPSLPLPPGVTADEGRELQQFALMLESVQMMQDKKQNDEDTEQQLHVLSQKTESINVQLRQIKKQQKMVESKFRKLEIWKSHLAQKEVQKTGDVYQLHKRQAEITEKQGQLSKDWKHVQTQLRRFRQVDGPEHDDEPEHMEIDDSMLLRWAVEDGNAEAVELLLDGGTDATVAHEDGWMPLHTAASKGHVDIIRLLLDMGGVDAESKNDYGWTALQLATERGYGDVARPLLRESANKDAAMAQVQWSHQYHGHVKFVAFSHDSRLLASATLDGNIRIWDIATGHFQETLQDPCRETRDGDRRWYTSLAFSHNSKALASGSNDGYIRIWDTTTGRCQGTRQNDSKSVLSVAFSHNSNLLASGSGTTIHIWDVATGSHQKTLEGHRGGINAVAFSNDPKLLASASNDGTVKLWNTTTGECQQTLQGRGMSVRSVTFSHDSKLLALGSELGIELWNTTTGQRQEILRGHKSEVRSLAFSYDSKLLASGSDDGTVKIWNTTTSQCQETLKGYNRCALPWVFPHGTKLAAARTGIYETFKVWVVPIDVLPVNMEET